MVMFGYKYHSNSYWDMRTKQPYIRLGCYCRTVKEWDADFDNNLEEFPYGSKEHELRLFVYACHKKHLELTKNNIDSQFNKENQLECNITGIN